MTVYRVTAPDGQAYRITVPDGVSVEQVAQTLGLSGKSDEAYDPTEGVSGFENAAAGLGKAGYDAARGIGQRLRGIMPDAVADAVGLPDEADIDAVRERDAPLMNTGAGFAGNVAGNIGMAIPAAFVPGANTLVGGALTGAMLGAIQPTATGESAYQNAALGGVLGGAVPAAIGTYRGVKELAAPLVAQDRVLGGALVRSIGEQNANRVAQTLATPAVARTPGVRLSAAEVADNEGLSAVEDVIRARSPGGFLSTQAQGNRNALASTLRGIAQDDTAIEAAKQARTLASEPLYTAARRSTAEADPTRTVQLIDRIMDANPANTQLNSALKGIRETLFESYPAQQRGSDAWKILDQAVNGQHKGAAGWAEAKAARTIMDRVRKGTLSAEEALAEMKGLKPKSKTFADAVDQARQYMKTPEFVLRQKPRDLISAVDNVQALLGKAENAYVRRELGTVKKSLMHQISKSVPEQRAADKAFQAMSRPINQMQVGRALADKLIPATAGDSPAALNAASLAGAMRNPNQVAQTATGFKRARFDQVMDPAQSAAIRGVTDDASKMAESVRRAVGSNSATARRIFTSNLIANHVTENAPVLMQLVSYVGKLPGAPAIGKTGTALGSLASKPLEAQMFARLDELMATNPQALGKIISDELKRLTPQQQQALIKTLPPRLAQTLLIGSVGSQAASRNATQ